MGLLRILLAICVLFTHTRQFGGLQWIDGQLAVELFFIISGFYMQLILTEKYTPKRLGKGWAIQFYKARYSRLFPAYTAGSLLAILLALAFRAHDPSPLRTWRLIQALPNSAGNLLFKLYLFFTNLTMMFQDLTMFLGSSHGSVHWTANFNTSQIPLWEGLTVPQAWSLGVELSFYLLAPLILRARSSWLCVFIAVSIAAKLFFMLGLHLGDPWSCRFFPFELSYFLVGALAYRHRAAMQKILPGKFRKTLAYGFIVAFVCLPIPANLATAVLPPVLACVLPALFAATASGRFDRLIGELSYPFYVCHYVVLRMAKGMVLWAHGPIWAEVWLALILTFALSALLLSLEMRYVEPWRARLAQPKMQTAAV